MNYPILDKRANIVLINKSEEKKYAANIMDVVRQLKMLRNMTGKYQLLLECLKQSLKA